MKAVVFTSIIALGLASCATPVAYGPATGANAAGFTEARIETDRYRVTYRGSSQGPGGLIHDYALLRAAELTLQDGYDWFRVTGRSEDFRGGNGPYMTVGGGSVDYGRSSAVGVGASGGFYLGGGPTQSVTLEIQMGRGAVPRDPDIYDAKDIAATIGARA